MSLLVKTNSTQGYHKPRAEGKAVYRVEYDDMCCSSVSQWNEILMDVTEAILSVKLNTYIPGILCL